jgi:hypothetical protein
MWLAAQVLRAAAAVAGCTVEVSIKQDRADADGFVPLGGRRSH